MSTGIFRFAVARRALARLTSRQWLLNLAVTHVPGPPVPLYLAGAQLLEVFPVVPLVGNETLNISVLSYAGQLNMTAVADEDACSDVDCSPRAFGTPTRSLRGPSSPRLEHVVATRGPAA